MIKKGKRDELKKWILRKYLTDFHIQYTNAGKPYIVTEESNHIYFSFTMDKKVAIMSVSDSDVGVDVVCRSRNLIELVKWAYPWSKLEFKNEDNQLNTVLSQELWCKIEAFIKLRGSTLLDFLSVKEKQNFLVTGGDVFFETLVFPEEVCVVTQNVPFMVNQIIHIDYYKLKSYIWG